MDIEKVYKEIISELKRGGRGLKKFAQEDFVELRNSLAQAIKTKDEEKIQQILCLLENSTSSSGEFRDCLLQILKSEEFSADLKIYALGASVKHVIQFSRLSGDKISYEYKQALKGLLKEKNPELVEWCLRTIDEMGNQALTLKEDIIESRPTILATFNRHKRASREIIDMILKKWS